ncbi:unnamed protein product [Ixodes pacificus]
MLRWLHYFFIYSSESSASSANSDSSAISASPDDPASVLSASGFLALAAASFLVLPCRNCSRQAVSGLTRVPNSISSMAEIMSAPVTVFRLLFTAKLLAHDVAYSTNTLAALESATRASLETFTPSGSASFTMRVTTDTGKWRSSGRSAIVGSQSRRRSMHRAALYDLIGMRVRENLRGTEHGANKTCDTAESCKPPFLPP